MSNTLSKRWVCVLLKTYLGFFLFEWSPLLLWVMRVYIVWVKGKKVTLKNPPGRMFRDYLTGRAYPRDTRETNSLAWLFSFQSYASHMPFFAGTLLANFSWASREMHWSSFHTQFFTNLILNPIQWNPTKYKEKKLKQLQYFLSWNKANI